MKGEGLQKKHQGLCGKMWHRLKEGEWLGRGIRNEREVEKKPSSQKQLSMTIRGQTTGEEEDPEQRDSAALTVHELDVQFLLPREFTLTAAQALKNVKH